MAFANPNISDIVATTIESRSGTVADNVSNSNALLKYIKKSGNTKPITGGSTIFEELSYPSAGNAGWYSGYDTLTVGPQDVISAAEFSLKQAATSVSISGLEELQNSGKEKIIDLLDARLEVAEQQLQNIIVQGLYSDGTGSSGKQITGLKAAVPLANTTGVYGGIDRAAWPFWRNKSFKASVNGTGDVDKDNIGAYMTSLYLSLIRGSDQPNLILTDPTFFAFLNNHMEGAQRFASAGEGALGFPSIKFMGADVIMDSTASGMDVGAYFLNTKYLKYRPHAKRNFTTLDPSMRYATNQDAKTQFIAWAGNLTCSNSALQGVLQN